MITGMMYAIGMFVLVFANDYVWTRWTRACAGNRIWDAVLSSVAIYLIGGVMVLGYVEQPWLLLPACAGAAFGTLVAMKYDPTQRPPAA